MIAVDTSALMAIVLNEDKANDCMVALQTDDKLIISAATIAESLIVAARRNLSEAMVNLIEGLGFEVVAVTAASARRTALAYERWGKGIHAAGLNLGDCFAYEVAAAHGCPLLYIGSDFAKTDIKSVL